MWNWSSLYGWPAGLCTAPAVSLAGSMAGIRTILLLCIACWIVLALPHQCALRSRMTHFLCARESPSPLTMLELNFVSICTDAIPTPWLIVITHGAGGDVKPHENQNMFFTSCLRRL